MDPTLGSLLGTLVGAAIAGGFGWLQLRRQRAWQLEDAQRTSTSERDREVRERADAKAEEVLAELQNLDRLLLRPIRFGPYIWPDDRAKSKEAHASVDRLGRAGMYLQEPLRHHVELAARVLPDIDRLVEERYLDGYARSAALVIIRTTQRMVARYLRNEPVTSGLTGRQEEILEAAGALDQAIEHQIEAQMSEPDDSSRA